MSQPTQEQWLQFVQNKLQPLSNGDEQAIRGALRTVKNIIRQNVAKDPHGNFQYQRKKLLIHNLDIGSCLNRLLHGPCAMEALSVAAEIAFGLWTSQEGLRYALCFFSRLAASLLAIVKRGEWGAEWGEGAPTLCSEAVRLLRVLFTFNKLVAGEANRKYALVELLTTSPGQYVMTTTNNVMLVHSLGLMETLCQAHPPIAMPGHLRPRLFHLLSASRDTAVHFAAMSVLASLLKHDDVVSRDEMETIVGFVRSPEPELVTKALNVLYTLCPMNAEMQNLALACEGLDCAMQALSSCVRVPALLAVFSMCLGNHHLAAAFVEKGGLGLLEEHKEGHLQALACFAAVAGAGVGTGAGVATGAGVVRPALPHAMYRTLLLCFGADRPSILKMLGCQVAVELWRTTEHAAEEYMAPILRRVVGLLEEREHEAIRGMAAHCIGLLAEHNPRIQKMVGEMRGVERLISFYQSKGLVKPAVSALAQLCRDKDNMQTFVSHADHDELLILFLRRTVNR